MELTWTQKALAVQSLVGWPKFSLRLRDDGSWYISHGIMRREKHSLAGGLVNGKTPEDAVNQLWIWLTEPDTELEVSDPPRTVKWNGFMWGTVND